MKKILLTAVLGTLCIFSHAQVTLSLLATESTCENNGSIEATANGVSPYSYELTGPQTDSQFDPGTVNFNSLVPGTYTVSVTDNAGQSTSENIEVTGNYVQPDLNIAVTNVSCPAGTDGGLV
ncbi:MAG: hypothetical protein KTR13_02245, partial [Saprospiraceae bacterium]|nr:hypothetical protein [Saprospiraceae bacterium]